MANRFGNWICFLPQVEGIWLSHWTTYVELEFFLRPTVSRPVRLGIGPPFGILDQILSCSSFFF
jgi:hypothetical protein